MVVDHTRFSADVPYGRSFGRGKRRKWRHRRRHRRHHSSFFAKYHYASAIAGRQSSPETFVSSFFVDVNGPGREGDGINCTLALYNCAYLMATRWGH